MFDRALISCIKTSSSWSNHLPKSTFWQHHIDVKTWTSELQGDTNIQTIAKHLRPSDKFRENNRSKNWTCLVPGKVLAGLQDTWMIQGIRLQIKVLIYEWKYWEYMVLSSTNQGNFVGNWRSLYFKVEREQRYNFLMVQNLQGKMRCFYSYSMYCTRN